MHENSMALVVAGLSVLASLITALVVWGNRGQVNTVNQTFETVRKELKAEMATAGGQFATVHQAIETIRQEFRANMAEAEIRIIKGINGTYTRTPLHNELVARVDRIEGRVDDLE